MSLCNLTIQYLESQGFHRLTGTCPVEGCGLPVARHRDENAPPPLPQAGKDSLPMMYEVLRNEGLLT
jgi:hypothetical protein